MPWYLPVSAPVFWEEMRRRLRGSRGQALLFAYVALLIGGVLTATALQPSSTSSNPRQWPVFGQQLWHVFLLGQAGMLTLICPGLTAGAISREREQHSLEQLFLTPLSAWSLALGKYGGAVSQLLVVVLAGLPVSSLVFLYGGVSPREVILGYAMLLGIGLFYAALGFCLSCLNARATAATVWAYAVTALLIVGVPLCWVLLVFCFPELMQDTGGMLLLDPTTLLAVYILGQPPANLDTPLLSRLAVLLIETALLLCASIILLRRLRGGEPLKQRVTRWGRELIAKATVE